ncbi:MAG: hypothetical protein H6807_12900 [Planctomycetes bacterium]|nr:hypothetical protein [Planctomycetota bacterium]
MILGWAIAALLWSSLVMAFDLTGLFLPDLSLAVAAWAALRFMRPGQDLNLVLVVGLVQGLFSLEPWFLPVSLALITLFLGKLAYRSLAPRALAGRALLVLALLLGLALVEILLRMSVPSLNLRPGLALLLAARAAASAALAVVLDGLGPRR